MISRMSSAATIDGNRLHQKDKDKMPRSDLIAASAAAFAAGVVLVEMWHRTRARREAAAMQRRSLAEAQILTIPRAPYEGRPKQA